MASDTSPPSKSPEPTPLPGRRPGASVRLQRVNGRFSRNYRHQSTSSSDIHNAGSDVSSPASESPAPSNGLGLSGSSFSPPLPTSGGRARTQGREDPLEHPSSPTEDGNNTLALPPTTFHPGAICAGNLHFFQVMKYSTSTPIAYVDRTSTIKTFMNLRGSHLLLRPRRSGKTTLIQMLHQFLVSDHIVDETFPDSESEKRLRLMRAMNLDVFKKSSGWNWQDHFAKYPVIHLNFMTARPDTYHERLVTDMTYYWLDWGQLFRSARLSKEQCDMVDWWTCKERRYNWASVDLRTSLADLIKLIHKVTGSQVVVLIDEYDHPFDVTSTDKDTMQVTADTRKFFGSFYSAAFDDNEGLKFALLVGVSGAPAKDWSTAINSLTIHTIDKKPESPNSDLSHVAMFTEPEVKRFYQSIALEKPELSTSLTVEDLMLWYDGYKTHSDVKLYNPVAISSALSSRRVGLYWVATGGTSELESFVAKASKRTRSDLVKLAKGTVRYLDIRMSSDEVHGFVTTRSYSQAEEIDKNVHALLIHAGYLSIESTGSTSCRVQIPSHEIHVGFWNRWLNRLPREL